MPPGWRAWPCPRPCPGGHGAAPGCPLVWPYLSQGLSSPHVPGDAASAFAVPQPLYPPAVFIRPACACMLIAPWRQRRRKSKMATAPTRRCVHCGERFEADRYNAHRQRYCEKPECRKASKAASQRRWLAKNPGYFHGPENCARVRAWRQANPGYWRRGKRRRARLPRPRTHRYPCAEQLPGAARHAATERGRSVALAPCQCAILAALRTALQDLASSQHVLVSSVETLLARRPLQDRFGEVAARPYVRTRHARSPADADSEQVTP